MEFLLSVGVVVLLVLVIKTRSRLSSLESEVKYLRKELQSFWDKVVAQSGAALGPPAESAIPQQMEVAPVVAHGDAPEEISQPLPVDEPTSELTLATSLAEIGEEPLTTTPAFSDAMAVNATAPEAPAALPPLDKINTGEWSNNAGNNFKVIEPSPPPAWLLKAKEWLFGGNLVVKVGLLILFIGVGFLLKFAVTRFSAPIELRLAGIVLADIGLLFWGWRIRESRPSISLPIQGGAIGILMLVTFAAFRLYSLIPGGVAFSLLFLLTFATCVLAILQDAIWLAIFGIVGGFAAPILTSTGGGSHIGLFSYYALLNAGILVIALKRSWRLLNLLGFIFTFAIGTTWGVLRYEPMFYQSVQAFLILFFVFYVAIAILFAHRQAVQLKHYVDGTLVFGTPLAAFGLQYSIIHDKPFGLAFSALALGLFYIGLTLLLWRKRGSSLKLLVESFLALGIVFGTLAIPLAFDGRWTATAWALEGAGIVWVGLRQKQTLAWIFGILVQVGAWVSFIISLFGLDAETAAQSNLWLGFLLLAVTGFLMALNFRKEAMQLEGDSEAMHSVGAHHSPSLLTTLSTVFLGFAAAWLLAGAWSEIFLRAGVRMPTLLTLSAIGVSAILLLLATRRDWPVSRYFALIPQVLAGVVFLALLSDTKLSSLITGDNLLDTNFLGALFIALGAIFSALNFQRQEVIQESAHPISRYLLGWASFWWLACALVIFSLWGENILARFDAFADLPRSPLHPLYCLLLAYSTLPIARLAKRLQWPDLNWLAAAVWPSLLFAMVLFFSTLSGHGAPLPYLPDVLAILALWLSSEWLLQESERENWLAPEHFSPFLRGLHTMRTVGPWLILWPLVHNLIEHWLHASVLAQNANLAETEWFVSGSWSHYLPAWAMMAYVALLIPRARSERWPTTPVADWYRNILIPLGAACALILAICWNFSQNGLMEPLPYLPILNPLDLTTGFAGLLSIAAWRLREQSVDTEHTEHTEPPFWLLPLVLGTAYVWFNLMLLRTAAHFLDIPYQASSLFRSQFIQAMLSLVWSASALVLMRLAARRLQRTLWVAGAVLLGLVVVKLFLVDLSNVGSIERIVSFLGVGALMLAIGYLAPFPSEKSTLPE